MTFVKVNPSPSSLDPKPQSLIREIQFKLNDLQEKKEFKSFIFNRTPKLSMTMTGLYVGTVLLFKLKFYLLCWLFFFLLSLLQNEPKALSEDGGDLNPQGFVFAAETLQLTREGLQ